jgi:hypothetical protein
MVTDILEKCRVSIFRVKPSKKRTGLLDPEDRNNPPLNIAFSPYECWNITVNSAIAIFFQILYNSTLSPSQHYIKQA